MAYAAMKNNQLFEVIDGKDGQPYEDIGIPVFSPDSQHIAFSAKIEGQWYVVVDGKKNGHGYDLIGLGGDFVGSPVFSPDSQHVGFVAVQGNDSFVVVDGQPGKPYDKILGIAFDTENSIHYLAQKDTDIYSVTVELN